VLPRAAIALQAHLLEQQAFLPALLVLLAFSVPHLDFLLFLDLAVQVGTAFRGKVPLKATVFAMRAGTVHQDQLRLWAVAIAMLAGFALQVQLRLKVVVPAKQGRSPKLVHHHVLYVLLERFPL
jgi:hypothetical protein